MSDPFNSLIEKFKIFRSMEEERFSALTRDEMLTELAKDCDMTSEEFEFVMRRSKELYQECVELDKATDTSHDSAMEKDTTASYLQHILSRVEAVSAHLTAIARLSVEGLMGGLHPIPVLGGSAEEGGAEKVHQAVEISGWHPEGNLLRMTIVWNGDGPSTEKPGIIVLNGADALTARWAYFAQSEGRSVGIAEIDWNGTAPNLKSISGVSGDILVIQWSATEQTLVLEFRL